LPSAADDTIALSPWGTGDTFLPARYAEEQRKFFGDVDVQLLDGCGHWPFIDDPERAAALIVPFLRKHLAAPPKIAQTPHVT
jgi:pimeloyl-ACP methyl ester carboxylesterase